MANLEATRPCRGGVALRTPLYDVHAEAGGRFVEFAGYDMPVHFGSIQDEHRAVRAGVGLFDVSHMSNVVLRGDSAGDAIAAVVPKDVRGLPVGKGQYTVMLRTDGTILDDLFVFRLDDEHWHLIPNAGRAAAVVEHLHAAGAKRLRDESADWGILALQGPQARSVLAEASSDDAPRFHHMSQMHIDKAPCLVSGTGYTGEKGVEVYCAAADTPRVWKHLMAAGEDAGIAPIGLGARDTLRLEKGYCLAGNEFAGGRTPLEANLGWLIDWEHDFIGRPALERQRDQGDHDILMGLTQEKGIPRPGYSVSQKGHDIGVVTSGTLSPTLGHGIALAYLRDAAIDDEVGVQVRGRLQEARVTAPPFI